MTDIQILHDFFEISDYEVVVTDHVGG
jgi:hypothetical protein